MRSKHFYVFVDLETTGLALPLPEANTTQREDQDEIIQIAAIAVGPAPLFKEFDVFEAKILPTENGLKRLELARKMAPELGKFDTAKWAAKSTPKPRVFDQFQKFLSKYACIEKTSKKGAKYSVAHLAGHNVDRFDLPFLFAAFRKAEVFLPAHGRPLDTAHLVSTLELLNQKLLPSHRLGDLCKTFGVELLNAHDALADIKATVELARAMMEYFPE
jgi:DNA polymerase III epsilon subunit-like protein